MQASVSVIIPCYCCAETIDKAVSSVASQTLRPHEVIIVDDGSKDNSLERLLEIQENYGKDWIKVIRLPKNGGVSVARNTAWDSASGDYVAFLDADDAWHPEKIKIQYAWMQTHPDAVFSGHFCAVANLDRNSKEDEILLPKQDLAVNWISRIKFLFFSLIPTTSVVMIKRNIDARFESGKKYGEDRHLWLEIVLNGGRASVIKLPLAYRFRKYFSQGGLGGNLWKMQASELDSYRKFWHHGYINFIEYGVIVLWSMAKYFRRVIIEKILRNT